MDINERIAKLQAELDALKAEAATAPKYKVGDRLIVPVIVMQDIDEDGDYYVKHTVTGEELGHMSESDLLPAAPRLVQADPAKLKPGDEVWIKGTYSRIDCEGDLWFDVIERRTFLKPANVYRLEQE